MCSKLVVHSLATGYRKMERYRYISVNGHSKMIVCMCGKLVVHSLATGYRKMES